jgi:hypothetical protein
LDSGHKGAVSSVRLIPESIIATFIVANEGIGKSNRKTRNFIIYILVGAMNLTKLSFAELVFLNVLQ